MGTALHEVSVWVNLSHKIFITFFPGQGSRLYFASLNGMMSQFLVFCRMVPLPGKSRVPCAHWATRQHRDGWRDASGFAGERAALRLKTSLSVCKLIHSSMDTPGRGRQPAGAAAGSSEILKRKGAAPFS